MEPAPGTEFPAPDAAPAPVVEPVPDVKPEPEPETKPEPEPEAKPAPEIEPVPEAVAPGADPAVTVKVNGGPYLVGQKFPVEITVTNLGGATATGVKAYGGSVSGSFVSFSSFGELGSGTAGASIPAGEKLVVTVEAVVYGWRGPPVDRLTIYSANDTSYDNNRFDWTAPIVAPDSGRGSISGLVYGDANGNGVADAGEGLEGVRISVNIDGNTVKVRTGADGRYRVGDLLLRNYDVYTGDAPGGWVVERNYQNVNVDGDELVDFRAVRPFSDQLDVSVDFTEDSYAVGQTAQITVVLTNKGSSDISGIKAGCDRSGGEGPHVVDMEIGDLEWNRPGVSVGAGRSLTLTITGVVPAKAASYASVYVACDFGPGDSPYGYPADVDTVRVPGAGNGDTWGVLYYDRDEDLMADADEFLAGLKVGAIDAISGQLVAKTTTDANGRLEFTNLPAGPYNLKFYGPWKSQYAGFTIGTCTFCDGGWYLNVVPGPNVPDTDPDPTPPTTGTSPTTSAPATSSPTVPPAAGGGAGGTTGGSLARTGANTVGLTAFGLLSLIVGFGAVIATGRRRTA